jgi:pimeloyl-ACP methyl ester carboxylesterase
VGVKGTPPPAGERLDDAPRLTRRRVLALGIAATAGGLFGVLELAEHGVLPGHQLLDDIDGACSVSGPAEEFFSAGPSVSGSFYSRARRREVGYTIAYPPGHRPGSELPLSLALHGYGGNHRDVLGISLSQALALKRGAQRLRPMALVSADGGGGYWNRHPDDDPMGMLVDELIPMCQRRGLGRPPQKIGAIGISMGGYGALLLAEKHPQLIAAVAAISPAIWTSYAQARAANAGAYASRADFEEDDVVTHVAAIAHTPVRVVSGIDDPFHPGVLALARALAPSAIVEISNGCHDGSFFSSQRPESMDFLASHIA